jgi:hypothetical protein
MLQVAGGKKEDCQNSQRDQNEDRRRQCESGLSERTIEQNIRERC